MSTFKFFVSRDKFLELLKYSGKYSQNLEMFTPIEKLKNWKYLHLENRWQIGTPIGTLAR